MSTLVQHPRQRPASLLKNKLRDVGTPFAKGQAMKKSISYREVILIIGVLVALLLLLLASFSYPSFSTSSIDVAPAAPGIERAVHGLLRLHDVVKAATF